MKTDAKKLFAGAVAGSLLAMGCLIPPKQAPSATPGSAASIGGGNTAAAAPAAPAGLAGFKDCGPDGLIDDGEDGNNQNLPNGDRGGYWYTFKDKTGTTTVDPTAGEEGGTFAMSEPGHNSKFAARFHGSVGTGSVVFAGMGTNLIDPKGAYDASKYAGIAFWAKRGEDSTGKVRLKVPDVNTDPDGGVCSECFNYFGGDLNLTTEWKLYIYPWKSMKQEVGWGNPLKKHISPEKLFGIQFQVKVPHSNYDIYVDDLKFLCQ